MGRNLMGPPVELETPDVADAEADFANHRRVARAVPIHAKRHLWLLLVRGKRFRQPNHAGIAESDPERRALACGELPGGLSCGSFLLSQKSEIAWVATT
jgi:hypothetical protein